MRRLLIPLLCAVGLLAPFVLVHAFCLTGLGGWMIAGVEFLLIIPVLASAVLFIISLLILAFRPQSSGALSGLTAAILCVILLVPAVALAHQLRQWGFHLAAERAEPLVQAIHRFERTNHHPPPEWSALIPSHLPALPSGVPPLKLITGAEAERNYYGNSWALVADVGTGVLNWDRFIYLPKQNYPEQGPSGSYQRIRDWAYYHE